MDDVRPDLVEHPAMVGIPGGDAEPLGGGLGHGGREVTDARDLDPWQLAEAAQVLAGDLARTDQGGFDHRRVIPRTAQGPGGPRPRPGCDR